MMITTRGTYLRELVNLLLGVIIALTALEAVSSPLFRALSGDRSTYSIVAVDPATGDVGAAGASCVPISAASLAALVPGKGGAAIQAAFTPKNQTKVFDLLQEGATASEIIGKISSETYDSTAGIRQYGVVTLHEGGLEAAGFTGDQTPAWSGDRQGSTHAVTVQGNTLEGEEVVADALEAFLATDIGPVELPDRLMRALEAASAAGGDRRCNSESGIQQTAEVAFVAVARAGQSPFITPIGKEASPNDPALPWLYISVIEAKGGPNPLIELRSRYDGWRSQNSPPCADCNLRAISVPQGGAPRPVIKAILIALNQIGLPLAAGLCCIFTFLLAIALLTTILIRRRRRPPN